MIVDLILDSINTYHDVKILISYHAQIEKTRRLCDIGFEQPKASKRGQLALPHTKKRHANWITRTKSQPCPSLQHPQCSSAKLTKSVTFENIPLWMKTPSTKHDTTRYCNYYQELKYRSKDCKKLKGFIWLLIAYGYVCVYIAHHQRAPSSASGEGAYLQRPTSASDPSSTHDLLKLSIPADTSSDRNSRTFSMPTK